MPTDPCRSLAMSLGPSSGKSLTPRDREKKTGRLVAPHLSVKLLKSIRITLFSLFYLGFSLSTVADGFATEATWTLRRCCHSARHCPWTCTDVEGLGWLTVVYLHSPSDPSNVKQKGPFLGNLMF